MRLETRKYLYDIQQAAALLKDFTVARRLGTMRVTPCCALLWSGNLKLSVRP